MVLSRQSLSGRGDAPFILLAGQQLSSYRIDRLLKQGGMAQVYLGWDVMLERPVAIKVIDTRLRSSSDYAERFLREARAVAGWRHEHIMQIYYADVQDGLYYFAMEYIDGLDLREMLSQYLQDGELMPQADVLRIGRAVALALAYAHEHGVVHRDVKPSNVMLSADGRVLLADFGLAMVVDEGSETEFLGTPHYVAPEQAIRAGDAVPQSDFYSLGVMLYEMLTGTPPFDDPSLTGLAFQHINDLPPSPRVLNPALSHETEQVLLRALDKEPNGRFPNGLVLIDALEAALATGHPVTGGWINLPPLPAGIRAETVAQAVSQLSPLSVVQKIAAQADRSEPPRSTAALPRFSWQQWVVGTLVMVGLLGLLLAGWFWSANGVGRVAQTAVPPQQTAVGIAQPPTLPAPIQYTGTAVATSTVPATTTPVATVSPTQAATPSPTPPNTATLLPNPTLSGANIQFLYDARSFYVYNPGDEPLAADSLSFLAVDAAGQPTGYSFVGREWAEFYPQIEPQSCARIEPIAYTRFLRPRECRRYNALVTPSLLDDMLFWVPRAEVRMFEVFWNGQFIGRCATDVDRCALNLPANSEQAES